MPDPLGPTDPRIRINGVAVAGFEYHDTRQHAVPGRLSAARVERFPGSRNGFVVKGRASRGLLVVTGVLRAATFDALYELIDQHTALVDADAEVSVTFHHTTFPSCAIVSFDLLDERPTTFRPDGEETLGAMIRARFQFLRLAA